MADILEYLKSHQTEMEETLLRLVQAESPSKDKNLVDLCGNVLQQEFEDLVRGKIERIPKEHVGDQFRFTYGEGTEQVLIIGHFDTVWNQGAIPIKKEAGRLYGPGTFDMKGGLTITLWALKALKELEFQGKSRIVLLATSDEEIGSLHSRQIIEDEARKSNCVFVPESSISPHGAVKTARKGVGIFKMKVKGVPVHAGIDPWSGVNAIEELALQIADLRKLSDRDRGVSVNVGVISGGTRTNVTAQYAEADIDVRFMTKEQGEELREILRNRQPYIEGAEIIVEGDINRFPLERNESVVQLYHDLKEIAESHGYELGEGLSGGGSDGNFTAGLGVPTIDGLGPIGDGAHAEHEHVVLDNLPYRAALLAEALKRYIKT